MFEAAAVLPPDPLWDVWWDLPRQPPDEAAPQHCPYALADRLGRDPGGVLAAAVEDATVDDRTADLDDDDLIAVATAAQRLLGWAIGAQLCAAAELGRRREASPLGERAAVAELALACGVSTYAMGQRMDAATVLPWRLPRVWAALVAGQLEWAKAWEILDKTLVLSDSHTAAVEEAALTVALAGNLPGLRDHLARAVLQVDPDGAADRARAAHARRGITFRPGPDSTGVMALTASAAAVADAEAALNRLTLAARERTEDADGPTRDDPYGSGTTRADVLLDLIHTADSDLTAPPPAVAPSPELAPEPAPAAEPSRGRPRFARGQVLVTLPLSTLLAIGDHPGELAGFGPIPAAMARDLAAQLWTGGTWRCVVTDDRPGQVHGTLLALGRPTLTTGYAPSPPSRDFVVVRDGTCRFPGCRRQATASQVDLDHRIPWPRGVTCTCNLEALCRSHHRLKHEAGFRVAPRPDGGLTWTTPTGQTHNKDPRVLPHAPLPISAHPAPLGARPAVRGGRPPQEPDPPPF